MTDRQEPDLLPRMVIHELRSDLRAILIAEEQPRPDWAAIEAKCRSVIHRLNTEPEPAYPHQVVYNFVEDVDIRRKDSGYAKWQRERLWAWLEHGAVPARTAITGWRAVLLAPIALPFALFAGLLSRPVDRTPAEVARFIQDLIDGAGGAWDWDEFESCSIKDPILEDYRRRAVRLGPPDPDIEGLKRIVAELRERHPNVS